MKSHPTMALTVLILVAAACGSDESGLPTDTGGDQSTEVATSVPSDPTDRPTSESSTEPPTNSSPREPDLPESSIPIVEFDGIARATSEPYFGADLDVGSGGSDDPEADEFCHALNVINNRPQPKGDDTEQIRVAGESFDAISSVVPDDLADEFDVIGAWIDGVIAAGSFDRYEESGGSGSDAGFDAAMVGVQDYVTERCLRSN